MAQSDSDRKLYEYQRQLKAPKVLSEKYPNIAKALDPYVLSKTDKDNFNTLGKNTPNDVNTKEGWIRDAEANAGEALAKDIYGTTSPEQLAEAIKQNKGLTYKAEGHAYPIDPKDEKAGKLPTYGFYDPSADRLSINTWYPNKDQLDTIVHEAGHAEDYKQHPEMAESLSRTESYHQPTIPEYKEYADALKNKDLYKASQMFSRDHFASPRSHSINELINQTKSGMQKEGIYPMPDANPVYDELNAIKPTVKSLEGYAPPEEDVSYFSKLRALLGK